MNPAKAVICAHYFPDNQRAQSIEGQIRECTEYAARNDMTILTSCIARALSATTADRPEFQRMIHDSEKGLSDVVPVWNSSVGGFLNSGLFNRSVRHICPRISPSAAN